MINTLVKTSCRHCGAGGPSRPLGPVCVSCMEKIDLVDMANRLGWVDGRCLIFVDAERLAGAGGQTTSCAVPSLGPVAQWGRLPMADPRHMEVVWK